MAVAVASSLKQWADSVLQLVGVPVTPTNEDTLYRWARSESGSNPLRWNNPLNTTENWPGAVPVNSAGVKRFPDLGTGARATAATLTNGYYPDILSALQNSIPTSQWGSAARAQVTKWGTNLAFLGGSGGAASTAHLFSSPTSGSTSVPSASSQGSTYDPFGFLGSAIQGAGNAIGGNIGGAITGAEQSLAKKALAAMEIAVGAIFLLAGMTILTFLVIGRPLGQGAEVVGSATGITPARFLRPKPAKAPAKAAAAKPAPAAKPAAAPAPSGQPITAGGREIKVTNPESRARLAGAGIAAA